MRHKAIMFPDTLPITNRCWSRAPLVHSSFRLGSKRCRHLSNNYRF